MIPCTCEHTPDGMPRATPEEFDHALAAAGEGHCPVCTTCLDLCVTIPDGKLTHALTRTRDGGHLDKIADFTGPFGRCPCCLGRYAAQGDTLIIYGVPTDPDGHEQPDSWSLA